MTACRVRHTDPQTAYIPVWGNGVGIAMVLILQWEKYTFGIFYNFSRDAPAKDLVLQQGLSWGNSRARLRAVPSLYNGNTNRCMGGNGEGNGRIILSSLNVLRYNLTCSLFCLLFCNGYMTTTQEVNYQVKVLVYHLCVHYTYIITQVTWCLIIAPQGQNTTLTAVRAGDRRRYSMQSPRMDLYEEQANRSEEG